MKAVGDRPPSSARGSRRFMAAIVPARAPRRHAIVPGHVKFGPMNITAPCVVSLTWQLSDAQNAPIDELAEPTEFFYGGDDLLPKVEEALAGQAAGFEVHLHLEPENAFGDYRLRARLLRGSRAVPRRRRGGHAVRRPARRRRHARHARGHRLHRHRGLPVARGAGRQPPARRPGDPHAHHGARRARGDGRGDRGAERAATTRRSLLQVLPPKDKSQLH